MPTTDYSQSTRIKKLAGMTINKFHTLNPSTPQGGRYNFENSRAILGTIGFINRKEIFLKTYVPEPPSSGLIYYLNKTTADGLTVGETVTKDMGNEIYTQEVRPTEYTTFFLGMAPFVDGNIIAGDKNTNDRLIASYWRDWGDDIFDDWGFFYLYDVESGKYYFPLISPQNQSDGVFATQTFNAFGRVFTIKHGWCVQGIFKFDISVNDNKLFRFGAYGNMGSDEHGVSDYLTQPYSLGSSNFTLYYLKNVDSYVTASPNEKLYAYFIPKNSQQNNSVTYNFNFDYSVVEGGYNSLKTNEITQGVLVYFSKTNDVKDWVIHDLGINFI